MSLKDAYAKKMQAELDEWNAEIDKLKARAKKADAQAQIEYHKQVENLQGMQDKAKHRLDELRASSDEAWEDVKKGAEDAWHALGEALTAARSRFK